MLPPDLNFGAPLWLWALCVLPVMVALFLWAERQAERRLSRLIQTPRLRQQLAGVASAMRRRTRYTLFLLGLAGLIATTAQPRWGYEVRETHRRGLDLMVIADVSKSMLATDLAPDRLTREKLAVNDLIRQLEGDRVGLVAFAGTAFLQAPLTIDYDAVLGASAELDTDLIPRGGTNLGGAIDLAMEAFGKNEAGNRAILLLTDGEATVEGERADGVAAARRAAAAGAKVFTIGLGTPEGSLIPLSGGHRGEFVRDEDGKIVRTRLDESALNEIARAGGGFYLRFTSGEATMRTLVQDGMGKLKAGEIDARTARRPIERYRWALIPALLCMAAGILIGERRRRGAPASIDGISPDTIAIPARRVKTQAQPSAVAVAAVAAWMVVGLGGAATLRAEDADKSPGPSPLDLYRQGHYEEAYRGYEDLAKKDPKQDGLQFNAGASAYMGKQYDEAMDAFGRALTSPDPTLRARSHYNFGNTLFRRGESQKDQKARLTDWRNALQHYESTLELLKKADSARRDAALAANTDYNRGLVQKLLKEEEQKPPPEKSPDQPKQEKKDQKDKKGDSTPPKKGQPPKQDGTKQDGKGQPTPSSDGSSSSPSPSPGGSSPSPDQKGDGNQPPTADQQGEGGKEGNQPPTPGSAGEPKQDPQGSEKTQPDASGTAGKDGQLKREGENANGQAGAGEPGSTPNPADLPDQDKPRQRGDFKSQSGPSDKSPDPSKSDEPGEAEALPEQSGKMSRAQAEALLNALKGEDAKIGLDPKNTHRRDEPVAKDW